MIPEPFSASEIAERQWRDYQARAPGTWFAEPGCSMDLDQAYAVQDAVTQLRVDAGDVIIGYKIGCTGLGTTKQFGMFGPIRGRLFRSERRSNAAVIEARAYANLAIEGEMAVLIGSDGQASEMLPIIELHDYIFRGPSNTLAELVANNGLHAGIVTASPPWPAPLATTSGRLGMTVRIDSVIRGEGPAWSHGDGPWLPIEWLRHHLSLHKQELAPGDLVLTGTPLRLYPVRSGETVTVEVDGRVAVECRVL